MDLTFGGLAREVLVCDFESVITCSKHRRNIFTSFIVSYLFYWVIATALGYLGVRGLGTAAWLLVPSFAFWLAYGYSPMCAPMVPTCLVDDFINVTQIVLPARIVWPQGLQVFPGCLDLFNQSGSVNSNGTASSTRPPAGFSKPDSPAMCMRSCRGEPFYFRSWESSLAWVACGFGPQTCGNLSLPYFSGFQAAANNFSTALELARRTGDGDPVNALSFCFWITLAQALPWLFAAVFAAYLAVALITVPLSIVGSLVQTITHVVAYSHVGMGERAKRD